MNSIDDTSISTRTDTTESIETIVDNNHRTLVIILAVTLPTLICIILFVLIIIYYRRRNTSIWLTKLESSSRLEGIVVNLSSPSLQAPYSEKKHYLLPLPSVQTYTETIIYNRLVGKSTSIPSARSAQGETNQAFEIYSTNHQQHPTSTLEKDFPVSLQAPVRTIDSTFVEAIAIHRLLTDPNHSSLETSTSTDSSDNNPPLRSLSSSSSTSNTSRTILLFSQRTQF